jgi:hypothetical protein
MLPRTFYRLELANTLAFCSQQIALEHVMGGINEPRSSNKEKGGPSVEEVVKFYKMTGRCCEDFLEEEDKLSRTAL